MTTTDERCETCRFWQPPPPPLSGWIFIKYGICRRYPRGEWADGPYWCGEYQRRPVQP
jgi:hypothetical protein